MNFKLSVAAACLASTFALLPGCAVDAPADEAEMEEAGTTEDELSANAKKLVGAFHGQSSVRPPTFQGLVFNADGTFFGDLDTGIRCITTPCPSSEHLEGRYTATKNYLRLTPKSGSTSGFYGRYRYTFVSDILTLTSASIGSGWSNTLTKELSYCAQASDCNAQALIHPMCVGTWTCGASAPNTCGYKCGVFPPPSPPGTAIWPAMATKLVAESAGGGFTPPPPAGSTCAIGRQKYSLDRTTRTLAWETCDWNNDGLPLHLKTGATVITTAELAKVNQAMLAVTVATADMCGADKPLYQIKVTSPAGEKTYTDSFYRCQGGSRTYVDGIDAVFDALRTAAE